MWIEPHCDSLCVKMMQSMARQTFGNLTFFMQYKQYC